MAGFDGKKAAKGLMNLGATWANSYFQRPRRSQVDRTALAQLGMEYRPSDIEGIMAQQKLTNPAVSNLSSKDLYNPSMKDQFRSMFGAGMQAYQASQGFTDEIRKLDFNGTGAGAQYENATDWGASNYAPYAQATPDEYGDTSIIPELQSVGGLYDPSHPSELGADYFESQLSCGGHLHKCGGHKYMGGGGMNGSNMLASAIDLTNAGLGVMFNALGMQEEKNLAAEDASKYNFDLQYLRDRNAHDLEAVTHDTKNNMLNMQAIQMRAHGGDLHTQGADFPMPGEYNYIGSGGTHESNPYSGVPQGIAADGQENLVEQNEVVWNDYVFSHRLKVPKAIRQKYKLRDDLFFSDAAERLITEAKERPNDPISQNGIEAKLTDLRDAQEDVRMRRQAAKVRRQLAGMSPEELMQLQALIEQGQGTPMSIEYAACGGQLHKFADGGDRVWTSPKSGQKYKVTQEFLDMLARGEAKVTEAEDGTLQVVRIKEPFRRKYRYSDTGERVARRYRRGDNDTLEELTGEYANDADYLDSEGNLVSSRMDVAKTPEDTARRESEALYTKTNEAIKEYIRKKHAGESLTDDDKRIEAKLKEVDDEFTRKNYADKNRLYDKEGNLRKDADLVLFGKEGKGGLRTDQKWGPNHWSADWLNKPVTEDAEETTPWEFEKYVEEQSPSREEVIRDTPAELLPTWMRYAPLAAPFLADYTARDYSTSIPPRAVTYRPIGDYLPYNPVDTQRYLTAVNQQDAARRGAIQNMSGANRNMAMAQDALAEYQRQQDIANVLNTAEGINFERRARVGDFNRGTNMFNAQAYNQTEMANSRIPEFMFHQAANNARMRKAVDDAIDEAKGVNYSTLLDNLHNIGTENFYFNQANTNPLLFYGEDKRGRISYRACGGMLTKRNKGRR